MPPSGTATIATTTTPCASRAAHAPGHELRRPLLQAAAAGLLLGPALLAPSRALLPAGELWRRPRQLWVTRPQAQEAVRAIYWADGALQPDGYAALNHLYRDIHANAQRPIAPGLLDLNFLMQVALAQLGRPRPLILLSGYRTRATNARVGGTEPNIHGLGMADDFRFDGLTLLENYRLARRFQVGGLGLYPDRGSLHKDLGRFRSWVTLGHPRDHGNDQAKVQANDQAKVQANSQANGANHEHASFR